MILASRLSRFVCAALTVVSMVAPSCNAHTTAPTTVPLDEMVYICSSLVNYVKMASYSKQSGMPLDLATAAVKNSMQRNLSSIPQVKLDRYKIVVGALFARIYGSQDTSMVAVNSNIVAACRLYAPDQYSETDIRNLGTCAMKASPYQGYADVRDKGMTLDAQLKWLRQQIDSMNQYTPDQKSRVYADLSDKVKYVYAHPEMKGEEIYHLKLSSCFTDSKTHADSAR